MSLLLRSAALALVVATVACSDLPDAEHPDFDHHCELQSANSVWSAMRLQLHHNDSRDCPHDAQPGVSYVEAGGIVRDVNVTNYPYLPGSYNYPTNMNLHIHNSNGGCQQEYLGSEVGDSNDNFSWEDFNYDGFFDWIAGAWANFLAGSGPDSQRDCPVFEVIRYYQSQNAIAITILNYSQ
jgi:hypothetical protein